MDCLRALGAAVICIGMVSGCGLPMWPSASGPGAAKLPDTVPPHPDELEAEHPKELKPATLVAYATLKEKFEKRGDHWIAKDPVPSDPGAEHR